MANKTDQIKFIIQRYDTYIAGVNTKGTFIVAFNTFFCGVAVSNYDKLKSMFVVNGNVAELNIHLLILFALAVVSTFIVGLAVFPYLKSGNSSKEKYHTLIFFGSVAEYKDESEYAAAFKKMTDDEFEADAAKQANLLARGVRNKFKLIGISMWVFFLQLLTLLSLLIFIIK